MPYVLQQDGYEHIQSVSSNTWTINHNINTSVPIIDCWIDVLGISTKIIPLTQTIIDSNNVEITFTNSQVGTAFIA